MTTPAPADLQRLSEELARNPASLAFLPLARAYRRQGRLDLAMRLCTRGLEQHPMHVEAHALLALLYLETGDRAKAADEWSTVLRLKPGNFEALRGMGFRYLEQGEIAKARQHLERAALIRPTDIAVQEALRLLRAHYGDGGIAIRTPAEAPASEPPRVPKPAAVNGSGNGKGASVPDAVASNPFAFAEPDDVAQVLELTEVTEADADEEPMPVPAQERERVPDVRPIEKSAAAPTPPPPAADLPVEPTRLFDAMLNGPVLGALLLDNRGLVLAGRIAGDAARRADEVGALIGGTVEEVARAVEHLELRQWRGMLMECGDALLQVSPVGEDALLVLAVRRDTPRGWVTRAAIHAASVAEPFLRSYV